MKAKCSHCNISFDEKVMIKQNELMFCCSGCQGVYHILQDANLNSFYDKVGNKTLKAPKDKANDLKRFDLDTFQKQYINIDENGFSNIELMIENIHCSACVWLNEKVLNDENAIIDATINFTTNKAKVTWDNQHIKLSKIVEIIQSIGYDASAYKSNEAMKKLEKNNRTYFMKMMVAIFASMNIMMIAIAKYQGYFTQIDDVILTSIHIAEFLLCTPVLFYSGSVFFKGAYFALKNKMINMDFLIISGAMITYLYSLYAVFYGVGQTYFDSVTMIVTFVLIGKYLENIGKKRASDTLDVIKSQIPTEATIVDDANMRKNIAIEEIKVGDTIELLHGQKAIVDGIVSKGISSFDQSSLTGESTLIEKKYGDTVLSGTINLNSTIQYKVTKNYKQSTLNNIVVMIEDAIASKTDIENSANELSKYFSVVILALSIITFISWYFYVDLTQATGIDVLSIAVSVVIIACPCALALATPLASLVGISQLAKKNIIYKEAKYIEVTAKATTVILDKTGTITNGKLNVVNTIKLVGTNSQITNLLYELVSSSNHPVSLSVKNYLESKYQSLSKNIQIENIDNTNSKGIKAKYQNNTLLAGNIEFMRQNNIIVSHNCTKTTFVFAIDDTAYLIFELEDTIKKDAKKVIHNLKNTNLNIIMATGDNEQVSKDIANKVGIETIYFDMSPKDKYELVKTLQQKGEIVAMVGDGANDSIALSQSDVAISMSQGVDIAISTSDIILMNSSMTSLEETFLVSRKTYRLIKQNLFISLIYNTITIPLAMFGYVIPLVAALSMSLSSLLVVLNSLRIKSKF